MLGLIFGEIPTQYCCFWKDENLAFLNFFFTHKEKVGKLFKIRKPVELEKCRSSWNVKNHGKGSKRGVLAARGRMWNFNHKKKFFMKLLVSEIWCHNFVFFFFVYKISGGSKWIRSLGWSGGEFKENEKQKKGITFGKCHKWIALGSSRSFTPTTIFFRHNLQPSWPL